MKTDKWKRRFYVNGTKPGSQYCVAQDLHGGWGCSCPRWKFKREDCKHIKAIRLGSEFGLGEDPEETKKFTAVLKQEGL